VAFPGNTFNFHPSVRPNPIEIHIQGFDHTNKAVRLLAMHRPAYNGVKKALSQSSEAQAIVFVSDRKQARLTALDFITMVSAEASSIDQRRFLGIKEGSSNYISDIKRKVNELTLKSTLEMGVGFLHDGMSDSEKDYIK
jgi:pre-mRNA-splicing helicase BRR2